MGMDCFIMMIQQFLMSLLTIPLRLLLTARRRIVIRLAVWYSTQY